MNIVYTDDFNVELNEIIEFIGQDSIERAFKFRDEILDKTDNVFPMPYRFRRNQKLNVEDVRDIIYKGYVVPFCIYDDHIEILGIFKENMHKFG